MGQLVRISEQKRADIGQVLLLTKSGLSQKEIAAELGRSASFVSSVVNNLPKLILAMEEAS